MIYVLPDTETLCIEHLKADNALHDLIPARSIAGELPQKATWPFLTVQLTGGNVPVERRLVGATVQVDAWGGTRAEARKLCATAHASLIEMGGIQPSGAVVTGVQTLIAPRKFPEPNRPRYQFEVRLWAHEL